MLLIGSHVSFDKKDQLVKSTKEAISYNATTFMFYTGAPQNTNRSKIDMEKTKEAVKLMAENNIDYCVLDMQEVDQKIGEEVLNKYQYIVKNYSTITADEKENIIKDMNNLIGDSTNFFYKKTIYKVKKDNK